MFASGGAAFAGRIVLDEITVKYLLCEHPRGFRRDEGRRVRATGSGVRAQNCRPISKLGITRMGNVVSDLLIEAKQVFGRLGELEHGANSDRAAQLVNAFIAAIESEPNASGLNKAAHALSWHLADQLEPLPHSLEISKLPSHARRIAKALSENHT